MYQHAQFCVSCIWKQVCNATIRKYRDQLLGTFISTYLANHAPGLRSLNALLHLSMLVVNLAAKCFKEAMPVSLASEKGEQGPAL